MRTQRCAATVGVIAVALLAPWSVSPQEISDGRVVIKNEAGDLLLVVEPDGSSVSFEYDEAGELIRTVDQDGIVTEWETIPDEAPPDEP
jgi:YD repeat-containing protein